MMMMRLRQSTRLQQRQQHVRRRRQLSSSSTEPVNKRRKDLHHYEQSEEEEKTCPNKRIQQRRHSTTTTTTMTSKATCPLRKREFELLLRLGRQNGGGYNNAAIMGVDEAGRGPLAGPVVVAAVCVPPPRQKQHAATTTTSTTPLVVDGVMDSKLIKKEEDRERIYDQLMELPDIQWAVAVVDATRIDEINILEATMEGMRMAVRGVMDAPKSKQQQQQHHHGNVCVTREGCYVVCSSPKRNKSNRESLQYYALIDGNRLPEDMPCEAEAIVKGDSKEYCIAAASILAKVMRDRLMNDYDKLYPHFELKRHKGYPTAAHMKLVKKHGASPIHRRSFAPLKYMSFDDDGRILTDES